MAVIFWLDYAVFIKHDDIMKITIIQKNTL